MISNEKASLQLLKITIVTLIIMLTCSVAVRAFNTEINTVKIVLADNGEVNIITTKTKVSEILEDNHIVVLPEETVFPSEDSEIGSDRIIKIVKSGSEDSNSVVVANSDEIVTLDKVLGNYATIVEKIEKVQEVIPYETITKDVSSSDNDNRITQVVREGKDGIKEVTYKVKYQNDIEISRTAIKEEIITEAVNKIIQVSKVSSRNASERVGTTEVAATASSNGISLASKVEGITPIVKTFNTSAYTASTCGKSPTSAGYGRTSSGAMASSWYTLAAGKDYPIGTIIYIPYFKDKPNGGWFVVQDRGGAISNNKLDVYMGTYNECIQFGRRNLECYVYEQ